MKIIKLNKEDFDIYASNHKYKSPYQTTAYGNLMEKQGFKANYLGFINNNNELIGASLLLEKKLVFKYKYAYAPNGFLIDYNNYDLMQEITNQLKKLLFKQNFIFFKIDPLIICSKRDNKGEIITYNKEINNILNILNKAGYKHKGFNKYFENSKARWNAVLTLNTNNERLFKNISNTTRNKINKANSMGVTIYKANDNELNTVYEFIKRKHYKKLEYYKQLLKEYKNNIEIYIAKIDPEIYVRNAKEEFEIIEEENMLITDKITKSVNDSKAFNKLLNKKMESDKLLGNKRENLVKATKMFQEYPNGIPIGGAIIIKQNETAHLLIEGFDKKYSNFNPNYLLKWELIKEFNNQGYQYFNLNAIVGEFKEKNKYSGLNEMKLGYNSEAIEYIGEFDCIINNIIYKFTNKIKKH